MENEMRRSIKKGSPLALGFGPCGGHGTCGKCQIQVLQGTLAVTDKERAFFSRKQLEEGMRLSCCHAQAPDDLIVRYRSEEKGFVIAGNSTRCYGPSSQRGYIAAIDIGTTTIALNVIRLEDGQVVKEALFANPQRKYGADVITRIDAVRQYGIDALRQPLLERIEQELYPVETLKRICVCGNPVMTHILMGIDPAPIGQASYTCPRSSLCLLDAGQLFDHLQGVPVQVLPPFCAFAGSDIVMDLYAVSEKEGLLIDLGTNGELALSHQGKWFVSSAACGPAFEGGNMACGSPAVNGAIDKVWYDKTWHWHTIGSVPAQSVCGSGYISWIASALDQDLLEESGYLSEEIELLPGIYLARQDIRSFQMAKGALAAAIETLCSYARMRVSEIERIVIAGGFGQHLDPAHLCQLGFFPAGFSGTVECVGNRALQGAARYAILQDHKTIEELIHRSVPVLLAVQPLFMERFAANMRLSSKKRKEP